MFMFGVSVSPRIKVVLGIVMVAIGVALHQVVLAAAGGVFVLLAGGQWMLRRRSTR